MHFSPSTYGSKIYQDFKEIDANEHRSMIRFFEDNQKDIKNLEMAEYFELHCQYLISLHETGSYEKYLNNADQAIESCIIHNLQFPNEKNIYRKLLFKKAASYFSLMEYKKAEHIWKELIKMNPNDEESIKSLKRSLWKQKPGYVKKTRAVSILMFMLSALIIAGELIIIKSFFPSLEADIQMIRSLIFFSGLSLLLLGDLIHHGSVNNKVKIFVEEAKEKIQSFLK